VNLINKLNIEFFKSALSLLLQLFCIEIIRKFSVNNIQILIMRTYNLMCLYKNDYRVQCITFNLIT